MFPQFRPSLGTFLDIMAGTIIWQYTITRSSSLVSCKQFIASIYWEVGLITDEHIFPFEPKMLKNETLKNETF